MLNQPLVATLVTVAAAALSAASVPGRFVCVAHTVPMKVIYRAQAKASRQN